MDLIAEGIENMLIETILFITVVAMAGAAIVKVYEMAGRTFYTART